MLFLLEANTIIDFLYWYFVAWINGGVIQNFSKKGSTCAQAQEKLVATKPSYSLKLITDLVTCDIRSFSCNPQILALRLMVSTHTYNCEYISCEQ